MLTRVAREKIKKENAWRAREVREKMGQNVISKKIKEGVKKKTQGEKRGKRRGAEKSIRRGLKALKEIKKFQSSTEMFI